VKRPNGNRPVVNKPTNNLVNRPTNVANISGNTVNRPVTVNKNDISAVGGSTRNAAVGSFNRPGWANERGSGGGWGGYQQWGGYQPWGGYHSGWYSGGWGNNWPVWPSMWAPTAAAATSVGVADQSSSSSSYAPTFNYSNPYYEEPETPVATGLDYSQALSMPTPQQVQRIDEEVPKKAVSKLDKARAAFKDGDYPEAQALVEQAIERLPSDTTLHEFRALVLFARKSYREAASALYAVLSVGPGMDWDTMSTLYPDTETYQKQLRSLESYVKGHPKAAYAHFLLAYHYLVLDEKEGATEELAAVVKLEPKNKLASNLYDALTSKAADATKPADKTKGEE
jgi:tetratricopeptide (TPR) repeat protein